MIESKPLGLLRQALAAQPRRTFAELPTPLHQARNLSSRLGIRLFIKRDDLTGLALGGNKARKLEFLLADALDYGCDSVITTGGSQSNHARLTAAACRLSGLECHLVLDRGLYPEPQGNMLLDLLFDARVHFVESAAPAVAAEEMERLAGELRAEGKNPVVIPRGGSIPRGDLGYAAMVPELIDQLDADGIQPDVLYLATGSTGTHAGTLSGLAAVGMPLPVQGISVSRPQDLQEPRVHEMANATLQLLGLGARVERSDVRVDDRFRGPGYGIPTEATLEAIRIAALDEAILLDPVYTGKAMAGLIGHVHEGRLRPGSTAIFLHTGGAPALFAYQEHLAHFIASGH